MHYQIARWGGHGVLFLVFLFVRIALVRWLKNTARVSYLNPEEFIAALVPTIIGISSSWIEAWTHRKLLALADGKIASEMMIKMNTYIECVLNNQIVRLIFYSLRPQKIVLFVDGTCFNDKLVK